MEGLETFSVLAEWLFPIVVGIGFLTVLALPLVYGVGRE